MSKNLPALCGIFMACLFLLSPGALAQETFSTPDEAAAALIEAAKADDGGRMGAILGQGSEDIISSGDPVADDSARQRFVEAYDKKHALTPQEGKTILVIGSEDWPFPVPLVKEANGWRFDAAQGREELLARRVGRNELDAMSVSLAYADAQHEYADMSRQATGLPAYAQRIISSPGKKDGLYWESKEGEPQSPLGEEIAKAASEGYKIEGKGQPYHGYYYRVLTRQGPAAPGGKLDYIANGKMIGGFGLIAYPAKYGNSGIMTFLINHDGVVYQKDLGPETATLAPKVHEFNPDESWQEAKLTQEAKLQE